MSSESEFQIRPERVAMYIRWSTEEQSEGTTLIEQREGCEFYVRSQGWFVNPDLIFIDDGYSGGSLDRPGMRQIRELVQKREIDCVVVLKIDRLSRNIVDATQLVLVEWKDRCHLRCVRQPIDTTSETGRMIFSILATFADFERAQISERTFQGRIRRLKEGKAYGGPNVPFGLMATGEPGVRAIDPDRGPIVAEMFRKVREERASVFDLAVWLEEQGVPPVNGKKWRYNSLRHILTNPIYAGRIVYGKSIPVKKPGVKCPAPKKRDQPLVDVEAVTVPAIVTQEVFDDVQAILAERSEFHKHHRRATDGGHLLSGIATCRCGGPMHVHWSRGERYYICSRRVAYGPNACTVENGVVLAAEVETAVVSDLLAVFGDQSKRPEAARAIQAQALKNVQGLQQELSKVRAELAKVDTRLSELRGAASLGDLSLSEWRDLRDALEIKRRDVLQHVATIEGAMEREERAAREERLLLHRMSLLDKWGDLPRTEQKNILRELAEKIELFKPRGWKQKYEISVVWRFAAPG